MAPYGAKSFSGAIFTETIPTPQSMAEGAKIILRVGTGDSGEGLNPHQEIIAAFEKANPDILVQLEAVAGELLLVGQLLVMAMAVGTAAGT